MPGREELEAARPGAAPVRAFWAVTLDHGTRAALAGIVARLRRAGADFRWVAPENLHLTLAFLGDIPASDVSRVAAAVEGAVAGMPPFTCLPEGLGGFPSAERPRVVWVGVRDGSEPLAALAAAVARACRDSGHPPDGRPFHPHLTLGRQRSPRGLEDLARVCRESPATGIPAIRVEKVALLGSRPLPGGPEYRLLAAVPLAGAAGR